MQVIRRIRGERMIGKRGRRMVVSTLCCIIYVILLQIIISPLRCTHTEIKYSSSRDLRAQLREIAPMNSEGSKIFCPNGPSANVSPLMENKCGGKFLFNAYTLALSAYFIICTNWNTFISTTQTVRHSPQSMDATMILWEIVYPDLEVWVPPMLLAFHS